jgi:pimeloyl-ACP methyl ester carboxylesterase
MLRYDPTAPAQVMSMLGAPEIVDGRGRFRQIFCALLEQKPDRLRRPCEALLHRLVDEPALSANAPLPLHTPGLRVVFVRGLFGACRGELVGTFAASIAPLNALGYVASAIPGSGEADAHDNIEGLARLLAGEAGERQLVLVGHSQGAFDILDYLSDHPEQARTVAAVVSVAGAINGSPLADLYVRRYKRLATTLPLSDCVARELRELEALRYAERLERLRGLALPPGVHVFSLVAFTALETMSHPLRPFAAELAHVDPRNDGQLAHIDQVVPGSTLLGYVNADHWSVATPIEEFHPAVATLVTGHNYFPRTTLVEAVLLRVREVLDEDRGTP